LIAGVGEFEFVEFEADAAAPVEGVLQAGEFARQGFQAIPTLVGVFDFLHGFEGLGDFIQELKGHGFVAVGAAVLVVDFGFFVGEAAVPFEALLVLEPVLVAGVAPFGEVLVGDGFAAVEFGQDLFGFGQFIYPRDDGAAEFAVVEAVV